MKKIMLISLITALMLASGCDYSATRTTQSSVETNTNGKVDVKTSSTVYTERVENGKTTNSSATISVGSKDASANVGQGNANQSANLSYVADDADLRKGESELDGYFINNGKNTVTIKKAYISLKFKDEKGKVIWEDDTIVDNLNITIKAGEKAQSDFIITNPNAPAYNGSFDLEYHIDYQ